jgi:hypothetical protein
MKVAVLLTSLLVTNCSKVHFNTPAAVATGKAQAPKVTLVSNPVSGVTGCQALVRPHLFGRD